MSFLHDNSYDADTTTMPTDHGKVRYAKGGYLLSSDTDLKLVRIAILGFWTEPVLQDFARDLLAEVRKVDAGDNRHVILCDLSGAVIQSQQIFEGFRDMLVQGPTFARRFALTTDSLAMRMQARRVTAVRNMIRMFDSEDAAMAWLLEEDAA